MTNIVQCDPKRCRHNKKHHKTPVVFDQDVTPPRNANEYGQWGDGNDEAESVAWLGYAKPGGGSYYSISPLGVSSPPLYKYMSVLSIKD